MNQPITITEPPASLTKYKHAATINAAEWLVAHILDLEAKGHTVLAATSARPTVPNKYPRAYRMRAPLWRFKPDARAVVMEDAPLQTRSNGVRIPAHFTVAGEVETPAGYRCLSRTVNTELIPS